jgi:hypothetical protein
MYKLRSGTTVDGVFSVDPVALSYLLKATGPVAMPKGDPLTADNAVRTLLSDVYANYPDPAAQDAYFAGAARAIFEELIEGRGDPKAMLDQLAKASGERRLLMWSAVPEEEATIDGTVLAGRMPTDDGTAPTVGVFLNDGSGAKLSYYLDQTVDLSVGDCGVDGRRDLKLRLDLRSSAPASKLPSYVTGLALSGDPYTVRTNVMIFSPTGGAVVDAALDGKPIDLGTGLERGRGVGVITVDLPPGSGKKLDVTLQTAELSVAQPVVAPRLWTTPTVRPWKTTVTPGPRCA